MRIDHDIPNVRNRIEAARKSPDYHCRMFVDIPVQVAERMCEDIAHLTAENARYREALTELTHAATGVQARIIANRALADADTGEGRGEGWIACSERMPELGGEYVVAVTTKDGRRWTEFAAFDAKGWWVDGGYDVTHWRPLPAPPRSEKKATP